MGLDWVVVGGEFGPNARPMHTDWARGLRDQCKAADIPFLFKQWGKWVGEDQKKFPVRTPVERWSGSGGTQLSTHDTSKDETVATLMCREGKRAAGRLLDGVLHDEYPKDKRQ